ncbi:uncharacterized protein MELLADRAFT_108111 [Melampsora larici-populina 98AG31]|uniref:Zn(2)-C6 fungal-type domain-containing protein n=1 Tax=Melampsora larici-populina (strain 98AG31 / pathotype 3-4-7) TaxID=747676 RepID=F4RS05_MELLP|nr:uncharacterized protein MELLADRAFT_108111 [Melampsora larici-populina 98AG31]EGG04863.1 hypothetical protein MELLADRAFT_108111 [Melampsora larici-populina 98AG31]
MNLQSDQKSHYNPLSSESHHHQLIPSSSTSVSNDSSVDSKTKSTIKRPKTTRACDPCRGKKIRCEVPELDRNNNVDQASIVCVHCRLHQINCTWFLPITETRFKRKRKNPSFDLSISTPSFEPNPQTTQHPLNHPILNNPSIPPQPQPPVPPTYPYPYSQSRSQPQSTPQSQINLNLNTSQCKDPNTTSNETTCGKAPSSGSAIPTFIASDDNRIYGSTSMSHIMHSTTTFPAHKISQFDEQFSQAFETGETGEGYIRVIGTDEEEEDDENSRTPNIEADEPNPSFGSLLSPLTTKSLIQSYFSLSARIFPVLNQEEFVNQTSVSGRSSNGHDGNALLYSVCCVGAMSYRVDPVIRKKLRKALYQLYRADDLLQSSDINTVIVLLLAGYTVEFEGAKVSKKAWTAIGAAVRIAQSLGMHRSGTFKNSPQEYRRLRRQIWACCIIADRWISVMIKLTDENLLGFDEHRALVELSILVGKVVKLLYSPTGLTNVTDEQVNSLLNELNLWYARLPDSPTTPATAWTAGHLRVYAVPVRFLIHRPFTQPSNGNPGRLRFAVGSLELEQMREETAECIRWVELHPDFLEAWAIGAYSFFVCCLTQYQAYVKFFSPSALEVLGRAKAIYEAIQAPECYIRLRTCEVIRALHRAATLAGSHPIGPSTSTTTPSDPSRDLYANTLGQSTQWGDLLNLDALFGLFNNNQAMMNDLNFLNLRNENLKAIEEEDPRNKEIESYGGIGYGDGHGVGVGIGSGVGVGVGVGVGGGLIENPTEQFWLGMGLSR